MVCIQYKPDRELVKNQKKRAEDRRTRHAKGKVLGIIAIVFIFFTEHKLFPVTEIRFLIGCTFRYFFLARNPLV